MVIFKSKQKKFEGDLKIKLCGKRLYPTKSVKYLGAITIINFRPRNSRANPLFKQSSILNFQGNKYA